MILRKLLVAVVFFVVGNAVLAQANLRDFDSFVYLNWANDLLVQTDYYFSNGLELGYIKTAKNHFLFRRDSLLAYNHFSIVQDFFTPTDINADTILAGDRPYAAYLYGSFQKHIFNTKQKLYFNTELFAGVIGPAALGRNLQTLTHELSPPSKPPQGWDNQVANDLALNLNFAVEKGIVEKEKLLLNAFSKARLGTVYTDLSIGGKLRYGKFNPFFQSLKNLTIAPPKKWQLFAELKPYLKIVGYNATLQGGLFNNTSPYTINASELCRVVGAVDLSLVASYKNFFFSAIYTRNSKEFETATRHKWITLEFAWTF